MINKRTFINVFVMLAVWGWVGVEVILSAATTTFAVEPIKIGASYSMTGKYAWQGERFYEALKCWETLINERGYSPGLEKYGRTGPGLINGRPVRFIVYDDKSDPSTGVKLYQKLITSDNVDFCIGPFSSGITKAISPIVERAEMPTVTGGAADAGIWKGQGLKWVVQGLYTTDAISIPVVDTAVKFGVKTAALVFSDDAFPTAMANSLRNDLENKGIKVVLFEPYPKGITDWTPPLMKAWALKPDFLGIGGYEPDSIGLSKASKAIKATPKLIFWAGAASSAHYAEAVGDACRGVTCEVAWDPSADTPGNKEFVRAFERIIKTPAPKMAMFTGMGFLGCQLLEIAVKKVGSLDKKAIRDTLFSMEAETIQGYHKVAPLSSKDSGLQIGGTPLLIQWQKKQTGVKISEDKTVVGDYVREVIWPEKWKSANPILFPGWQ